MKPKNTDRLYYSLWGAIALFMLLQPAAHAHETEPNFYQLTETFNAGIMVGLEAAGHSRLVSNCVWRVFMTVDQDVATVADPDLKAKDVPQSIQEYRWHIGYIRDQLPGYIDKCEALIAGDSND